MDPASTAFILGYHGCDHSIAQRVLAGRSSLEPSHNDYDWLGDGIYFWEHNARRAFDFAVEAASGRHLSRRPITKPAVVGAIIDLGLCLNVLDSRFIGMVRRAYDSLVEGSRTAGMELPRNAVGPDLLSRKLDCAVLRFLHETREEQGEPPFDTVRAAFIEGEPLYENAGFAAKSHIQVCVRNSACIKGYFRLLDESGKPPRFE